jgi:hypothetical protein
MVFALITLQAFWKVFLAVFFLCLAMFTFDHFKVDKQIKALFAKWKMPTQVA